MFASRITSLRARLAARLARTLVVAAASAAVVATAACSSDSIVAPAGKDVTAQSSSTTLVSTLTNTLTTTLNTTTNLLTQVTGLGYAKPATTASVSAVIGAQGGSLSLADGIRVTVPKGAVATNITFKVTRLAGNTVAYDFQPHGTTFAVPLQIEVPTGGTTFASQTRVRAAYFPESSLLNLVTGIGFVSEFRPTTVSADKAWIRFTVDHFSGYMVSLD